MPTNRLIVQEQIGIYTTTLFDAAMSSGGADAVLAVCVQGKKVVAALRGNAELDAALADPGYAPEQKAQLVRSVFAGCDAVLLDVLAVMAQREETDYLASVMGRFENRMRDELGLVIVEVRTAVELDDHLRDLIKKKIEAELGKKAVLDEYVDKSIMGGIIMSTGDERIDASILTQVGKIRDALEK